MTGISSFDPAASSPQQDHNPDPGRRASLRERHPRWWYAGLQVLGLLVVYLVGGMLVFIAGIAVLNTGYCRVPHEAANTSMHILVPLCGGFVAVLLAFWGQLSHRYRRTALAWRISSAGVVVLTLATVGRFWNGYDNCGGFFT